MTWTLLFGTRNARIRSTKKSRIRIKACPPSQPVLEREPVYSGFEELHLRFDVFDAFDAEFFEVVKGSELGVEFNECLDPCIVYLAF